MRELERQDSVKWPVEAIRHRALTRLRSAIDRKLSERYMELVDAFARYFAGEAGKLPLDKGIILHGPVGCGKTTLFRAFNFGAVYSCDNPRRPLTADNTRLFSIVPCSRIAREYADKENGGVQVLKRYFTGNFMFDDLGTENVAKYYGTAMDVMGEIMLERYDNPVITFMTTNLTYDQIRQSYGERFASRLSERCSWVDMGINEDYRR
ncbi:MAG: hypothetical protein NC048_09825 [Bacteroides sp.]|nr:hypothetical protein [Bacteroides sp.]MCM1555771.1 hypothetical protein [Bacteroides sp.]